MKVHYYWSEDGVSELCGYEKSVAEQEERCYHCDNQIPVGTECIKLTAGDKEVYFIHNDCAKKGVNLRICCNA